jgi:hypothetical protein
VQSGIFVACFTKTKIKNRMTHVSKGKWNDLFVRITCLSAFLFMGYADASQNPWFKAGGSKEITQNLQLSVYPQLRYKDHLNPGEYFIDSGLEYALNKFFAVGTIYRIGYQVNDIRESDPFRRLVLETKTNYIRNALKTKLRFRYTNTKVLQNNPTDAAHHFRVKFKMAYKISKLDITPYLAYEIYRNVPDKAFEKSHSDAGIEYKMLPAHRIGTYYRLQNVMIGDEVNHIVGLTYKVSL